MVRDRNIKDILKWQNQQPGDRIGGGGDGERDITDGFQGVS